MPLVERLGQQPVLGSIEAAGREVASSLRAGGKVWVTETTHCLHSEATYRAGGLMAVHAMRDAVVVQPGDCVIEGSPVGTSVLALDCALGAKARGACLVALTNVAFELDGQTIVEHSSRARLHEVADIIVDLAGPVGDGVFRHPDDPMRVMPHSGVTGMVAMWMIFSEAAGILGEQDQVPHFYECVMVAGAAAKNAAARDAYIETGSGVRSLAGVSTTVTQLG
jgi:uncharacterized phosphosugar-binding protein